MTTTKNLYIHTPPEIREELKIMEADVHLERFSTLDMDIDAKITSWIPNTRSSRSLETKYYHTIDLYWHVKALLGKGKSNTIEL